MIWMYQLVDIVSTLSQVFVFYIIMNCLCKNPRSRVCRYIPVLMVLVLIFLWTWFIEDASWKLISELLLFLALNLLCYRDAAYNIIAGTFMSLVLVGAIEAFAFLLGEQFVSSMVITIDGVLIAALPVYFFNIIINLIVAAVLFFLFRDFRYRLNIRDFMIVFLFEATLFFVFQTQNTSLFFQGFVDQKTRTVMILLTMAFIIVFLYLKNNYYLLEQEQRDKLKIAQLQQQYAYYQDKLKDEERIRSIYHDMKNHLLVLEGSQGTEATREMAQKLRAQIAGYENYIHTGNDFLDIIIRDKAEKAREKDIDLEAAIDFVGIDFIDPLDISTLFGNGIDNAMEASEKLPPKQRVILIRAARVQDFVSILIENNCADIPPTGSRAAKADKFLHGFGISNMQKAAEKYSGTCTTARKDGRFALKILIPMPTCCAG